MRSFPYRLILFALVAVRALSAQSPGQVTAQPGNLAGLLFASSFGQWQVPQGNAGQFSWNNPNFCKANADGFYLNPVFAVGTPITIVDAVAANTETVIPSAVSIGTSGCSITVSPAHPHLSFYLTSGTGGLQEAINYAHHLPYQVVATNDWTRLGGQTGMLSAAINGTNVGVVDWRTNCPVPYSWSGSAYVAGTSWCSGGGGGPCGPLLSDATSTNCGNGNDVGNTGTAVQTFGYTNVDGGNASTSVVAVGKNNLQGTFSGDDVGVIGLSNISAGPTATLNKTHFLGSLNGNNLSSSTTSDGVGYFNCNFTGMTTVSITDTLCYGDGSVTGTGSAGDLTLSDAVGLGDEAIGNISGTLRDLVGVGNGVLNIAGDGDSDLIGIGDASTSNIAATVTDIIGIGNGASSSIGAGSDDIVGIGTGSSAFQGAGTSEVVGIGTGASAHQGAGNFAIVGIGLAAAANIPTGGNEIIGIGLAAAANLGAGASNIVGVGESSCAGAGAAATQLICIGTNAGASLGPASANVIQIGNSTATSGYGGSVYTDSIAIGNNQITASDQITIGDSSITQLLLFGCPSGKVVLDDGSGTCVTPGGSSPLTTKGDIFVYSSTNDRLPVGTNGQVLSANSAQSTGLQWVNSLSNPMSAVGDVIAGGASGVATRVAANTTTNAYCLIETGTGSAGQAPVWSACSGSSATALSSVSAASTNATIANANNPIAWNWAQTSNSQTAFTFGETSAATGTSDLEVAVKTVAGSTAVPLTISDSLNSAQTLPALQILPTWNTTGVVDAALLVNVTNTASGAASKLFDLQVGGTSKLAVDKAGIITNATWQGVAITNTYLANAATTVDGQTCTLGSTCTIPNGSSSVFGTVKVDNTTIIASAGVISAVAPVASVANSDSTLTISPTTGSVVASLNLAHANTWTALLTESAGVNLSGASAPLEFGGSAGTTGQCALSAGAGTTPTWGTCPGSGAAAWSALTSATGNLSLSNAAYSTTFNQVSTGSGDLFKWADTGTGTGVLAHFTVGLGSSEVPWQADVNGLGWKVGTDGSLQAVGSSPSHGVTIPGGSPLGGIAGSLRITTDSSGLAYFNENNTGSARVCTSLNAASVTGCQGTTGGTPGGSSGQVQFNNAGAFGGFTVGGDGTLNTATGALTVTKSNGTAFGTAAFANTGTSGATVPLLNASNAFSALNGFSAGLLLTYGGAASRSALYDTGSLFTGGTGTTTWPHWYIDQNTGTEPTWTAGGLGTVIGINEPSSFQSGGGGVLFDYFVAGTEYLSIDAFGNIQSLGDINSGSYVAAPSLRVTGGTFDRVYRCATAGALPVGALTVNTGSCGTTVDTGIQVK